MAEFKVRTKSGVENPDITGKARVYFTCHPKDKETYFDQICKYIFRTHDCTVFHTEDMEESLDQQDIDVDLAKMQLFIVPVTWKLLKEPNRAMSVDIAYAKDNHIPILPFLMEDKIEEFYAMPENFGDIQYINPYSTDATEIHFEEKLSKHLDEILGDRNLIERIKNAFDAYIFLSYRKKDRHYANDLMKVIHSIPNCRDVAIWYDEFITLGEHWRENIKNAMYMVKEQSNLFAMIVTPNILEEYIDENGEVKKNFVMGNEYPEARDIKMNILPTEMEETDYSALKDKFDGIPMPVRWDGEDFAQYIHRTIEEMNVPDNDSDPEHNYLIGLAYLKGIDVELNVELGIELITKAADAGNVEAMAQLYVIYLKGYRVKIDYDKALMWSKKMIAFYEKNLGPNDPLTLIAYESSLLVYSSKGEFDNALKCAKRLLKIYRSKSYAADATRIGNKIADLYYQKGEYHDALKYAGEIYNKSIDNPGSIDNDVLLGALQTIALSYSDLGELDDAIRIQKKLYELRKSTFGPNDITTLNTRCILALFYAKKRDRQSLLLALDIYKQIYSMCDDNLIKDVTFRLKVKLGIANVYGRIDNFGRSLKMKQEVYNESLDVFGELHPITLEAMNNLASTYMAMFEKSLDPELLPKILEIREKLCVLHSRVYSPTHKTSLFVYANLAYALFAAQKDWPRAFRIAKDIRHLCESTLGADHVSTKVTNLIYHTLKDKFE